MTRSFQKKIIVESTGRNNINERKKFVSEYTIVITEAESRKIVFHVFNVFCKIKLLYKRKTKIFTQLQYTYNFIRKMKY